MRLEFLLNGFVFVLIGLQLPDVLAGIHGMSTLNLLTYGMVFLGDSCRTADGVDVSSIERGVVGSNALRASGIREAESESGLRVGLTGMRGVVAPRCCWFPAFDAQRRQPVSAAELHHLPDICADPCDGCAAGTLAALGCPCAPAGGRRHGLLRGGTGEASDVAGCDRLPQRTPQRRRGRRRLPLV